MNVVIFGKGFGKPRQFNLSGLGASLASVAVVGIVIGLGFGGGYWYSSKTGSGVSNNELVELTGELKEQQQRIAAIRQGNEDTLDALAIRIAQMNARVIRLDALGRRLTDMADIDDGEFDFDSEPALGGPEEPMAAGSNVAVPEVVDAMQSLNAQLSSREAQLNVLEDVLMNQNLMSACTRRDDPWVRAGSHPTSASARTPSPVKRLTTPALILPARWVPRSLRWLTAS